MDLAPIHFQYAAKIVNFPMDPEKQCTCDTQQVPRCTKTPRYGSH